MLWRWNIYRSNERTTWNVKDGFDSIMEAWEKRGSVYLLGTASFLRHSGICHLLLYEGIILNGVWRI